MSYCSCGCPIPHEHDQTDREKAIIAQLKPKADLFGELVEACKQARFVYDYTICREPTGKDRNKVTERNILRMHVLAKAREVE